VKDAMLKKGDRFREAKTGLIYTVKNVLDRVVTLETDDGLHRMLINWEDLDSSYVKVQGEDKE
jgi:hypothetical protein